MRNISIPLDRGAQQKCEGNKGKACEYYGGFASSYSNVKYWIAGFKSDEHAGAIPKTVTTSENMEKIHDFVLDGPKVKVCEIAAAVGISTGSWGGLNFTLTFVFEKADLKMGAAFVYNRSKT